MSDVLHECMVKALRSRDASVYPGVRWVLSRRGTLRVRTDRLECGNWIIPYPDIREAVLLSVPWLWMKAYMLTVRTAETTYQFGVNPGAFWRGSLPFPLTRRAGGVFWGIVNIVRIVVFGVLLFWLIKSI